MSLQSSNNDTPEDISEKQIDKNRELVKNEFPDFVSNSCKQGNYIRASKDVIGDKNRLHINFSIKNATGSKYYNFNTEENSPKITLNQERDWYN